VFISPDLMLKAKEIASRRITAFPPVSVNQLVLDIVQSVKNIKNSEFQVLAPLTALFCQDFVQYMSLHNDFVFTLSMLNPGIISADQVLRTVESKQIP
jgi:hypothetical protein